MDYDSRLNGFLLGTNSMLNGRSLPPAERAKARLPEFSLFCAEKRPFLSFSTTAKWGPPEGYCGAPLDSRPRPSNVTTGEGVNRSSVCWVRWDDLEITISVHNIRKQ